MTDDFSWVEPKTATKLWSEQAAIAVYEKSKSAMYNPRRPGSVQTITSYTFNGLPASLDRLARTVLV